MLILCGFNKNPVYMREVTKNQYIGGNFLKRGEAWTISRFKGGSLAKKRKGVLLRGLPIHTMNLAITLTVILIY